MAESLKCPNCGAPLAYGPNYEATIRCSYRESTVIIPEELQAGWQAAARSFAVLSDLAAEQIAALKKIGHLLQ